jgi:ATP-dependent DNA helicase RecG
VRTFADLFDALLVGDESSQIEAKRSSEIGKATLFTITSYSNEPGLGGGYFLLGVAKQDNRYEVVGVPDPDKLQADIAAKCATDFSHPIRPEITLEVYGGKPVIIVRIPEADPSDKPVYIKKYGLPQGACRRIGSIDQHCTHDDVTYLVRLQDQNSFDASVVSDATLDDIDPTAIAEYRRTRLNSEASELKLSDRDLLIAIGGATTRPQRQVAITRAGLILFGKPESLRRLTPSARIDYILVAGQTWVPDAMEPLTGTELREPLLLAIPRIASHVLQDLPTTFQIKGRGLRRKEVPVIPQRVIREAIVNAVMHRSYRAQEPVQIVRFSNRLEIRNPGHSLVSDEELGQPGSKTRNERIAAVLHDCGYAETKGTGIRVMIDQMRDANLTEPIFRSSRQQDSFDVTLLTHHLVDEQTVEWLRRFKSLNLSDEDAKALVVAREVGHIDNALYRNVNGVDTLTASTALRRLRDAGLLEIHGKSTATFYTPTPAMLGTTADLRVKGPLKPRATLPRESNTLEVDEDVLGLLRKIGDRAPNPKMVELAILRLCAIRPMTKDELCRYLQRQPRYLSRVFLQRMVKEGVLLLTHPESPRQSRIQAYTTAPWMATVPVPSEVKRKKSRHRQRRLF